MTQYLYCVRCRLAKTKMVISGGSSYCVECQWNPEPSLFTEDIKRRERDALTGVGVLDI